MMKWIFSGMILSGCVFGLITGRMNEVSNAAIGSCAEAVQLSVTLLGSMCLWSGLMKVAEEARLTEKLSRLFSPLIGFLFEGMDHKSEAAKAVTLNISSNLLGLGNAATPLGIAAMKAMEKENPHKGVASNNMAMFVVLNTASMQLVPTTTAILRQAAGSPRPLDIMPAVWVASLTSLAAGVVVAKLLAGFDKEERPRDLGQHDHSRRHLRHHPVRARTKG